jgi:1A family penicillin-binding protein
MENGRWMIYSLDPVYYTYMTELARIRHFSFSRLKQNLKEIKENPAMLKKIIRELWLTFKQPIKLVVIVGFIIFLLVPPLTYIWFVRDLSSKEKIINRKNAGVILLDRNDTSFFTLYGGRTRKTVPLSEIPESMQESVIASEDKDFYHHPGFSIQGIGRALLANFHEERLAQGGSTISQQLVKNTLLTQNKNFLRKYQEIILALEIERRFSKQDILEMYLNTVYFGEGAFGVEEAAESYFNKHASDLTLSESALLTAILPAPSALSPISGNRDRAFERQKLVLSLMKVQGFITEEQETAAADRKLTFTQQAVDDTVQAPHFALMVKDELIKRYGEQRVANSGFKVKTTIDLDQQIYAENTVENQVDRLRGSDVSNGAAVAMDPKTGEILALVGSHNWFDDSNGKINMAIRPRQPGSSFKPIVYAKAFEEKILTPASVLEDKAINIGGYKPKNYDGRFRGNVLVRFALANSLNIPAVLALEKVGVPDALDMARDLGITTLTNERDYGLALVLGAGEVPLLQMTNAYGVFANDGVRVEPTTILEIKDKNDRSIYRHDPEQRTVVDDGVAYLISSILSDNPARAEVFGSALTISRPAAVKTGTTDDYRDAWTIGYTPSLVVGAWVGNNDRKPMSRIAGSLGAAPIWRLMMEHFLAGTPVERFERPLGIVSETVCKDKGLKTTVATSSAYLEYFLSGTLPTRDCNLPDISPSTSPTPSTTETPTTTPEPDKPTDTPTPTQSQATPTTASSPTTTPIDIQVP